ncbi:hypothetical protein FHT93_003880 [Rhizobium sp. BK379]|nr:hypothetical protein [Rhizobium sp. BK379]
MVCPCRPETGAWWRSGRYPPFSGSDHRGPPVASRPRAIRRLALERPATYALSASLGIGTEKFHSDVAAMQHLRVHPSGQKGKACMRLHCEQAVDNVWVTVIGRTARFLSVHHQLAKVHRLGRHSFQPLLGLRRKRCRDGSGAPHWVERPFSFQPMSGEMLRILFQKRSGGKVRDGGGATGCFSGCEQLRSFEFGPRQIGRSVGALNFGLCNRSNERFRRDTPRPGRSDGLPVEQPWFQGTL